MEKMNVVVSMVKTRFYDFPAAILLIAEIVFDKETHSPRISGTYTRAHQGNFPNEPHFEPRAGLCARRQFKLFAVRGGRRPPPGFNRLHECWSRRIRKTVHRISPFTRRGHAKKNNQDHPARRMG